MRAKTIEIANALLEQGYEEEKAIRIAIAQAKHWAERAGRRPSVACTWRSMSSRARRERGGALADLGIDP